jgi:uncharacterized protein (TIGR02246 family)
MAATEAGAQQAALSAQDRAALSALVQAYQDSWNASDLTAMGRLYRDDVHWVNVRGMHWRGFEEVDRAHRVFFKIMFTGVRNDLDEIESVTPIAPGVAVMVVRWRFGAFVTPDGVHLPPHRSRMTLVVAKGADGWRIVHGHNIEIDENAARFDPIRGAAMKDAPR